MIKSESRESCTANAEETLQLCLASEDESDQLTTNEVFSRRRDLKALQKQEKAEGKLAIEHKSRKGERYWSQEEHERFIEAVKHYGKSWSRITSYIGTRSRQSVYSHAQKFREQVEREPNLIGAECALILAKLDQQHYGQSSIMRARSSRIEDIPPSQASE